MNYRALFDAFLALVAFWLAWQPSSGRPALRLAAFIFAIAATLGALRFSNVLPLPSLHQFFSMMGSGVAFPLLALTFIDPNNLIVCERRYTWIFAVIAAIACILIGMIAQIRWWMAVCSLGSVIIMIGSGLIKKQPGVVIASLVLLIGMVVFSMKLSVQELVPGDLLHVSMAFGLLILGLQKRYCFEFSA